MIDLVAGIFLAEFCVVCIKAHAGIPSGNGFDKIGRKIFGQSFMDGDLGELFGLRSGNTLLVLFVAVSADILFYL